jgi:hypothetical protein
MCLVTHALVQVAYLTLMLFTGWAGCRALPLLPRRGPLLRGRSLGFTGLARRPPFSMDGFLHALLVQPSGLGHPLIAVGRRLIG